MSKLSNLISPSTLSMLGLYVINQIPGITSFPGLVTAAQTAVTDHTPKSFLDLGVQVLFAGAVFLRAGKLAKDSANKSGSSL